MAGLPEPGTAYALFIGVEEFDDPLYRPLPTSRASVAELAGMMADPDGIMWRLPAGRIDSFPGAGGRITAKEARTALKRAVQAENLQALLVCISCHGYRYPDDGHNPQGLHLAMSDSDTELPGSHLHFNEIRNLLEQAARDRGIKHILLIVDACLADGTKVHPGQGGGDAAEFDHLAVPGVVVLSATKRRVIAWPHWRDTTWTAFLGALIESIKAGAPSQSESEILTAKNVFDEAVRRLADARRGNPRIPIPDPGIERSGQSDIPLCRNRAFIKPVKTESGGGGGTAGFADADECFAAIRAAHEASQDESIPGIVRDMCERDDVPEVAALMRKLAASEFSGYLPHAYQAACASRPPADIALFADALHRNGVPIDEKLVLAWRGRDDGGRLAAEVYRALQAGPCQDCHAAAELISAQLIGNPELSALSAAALAAWT